MKIGYDWSYHRLQSYETRVGGVNHQNRPLCVYRFQQALSILTNIEQQPDCEARVHINRTFPETTTRGTRIFDSGSCDDKLIRDALSLFDDSRTATTVFPVTRSGLCTTSIFSCQTQSLYRVAWLYVDVDFSMRKNASPLSRHDEITQFP